MKVGDLVEYTEKDSPLGRFRRYGIITTQNNNRFGTVVFWFRDKQFTHECEQHLKVVNESS